jgi:hypothetical protein
LNRMTERRFAPGFRLSKLDVAILIAGGAFALAVGLVNVWFGLAIAFVVGHFFLFCNVLRMSRPLELIWATVFGGLAVASAVFGLIGWPVVLGVAALLTVVLAAIEMRRPSYHGVGWETLNPTLPGWCKRQREGV